MAKRVIVLAAVLFLGLSSVASAQWRGLGRANGKVVDEAGAPMADVTVRADLPGVGGTTIKTNDKGEWVLSGIAKGDWTITVVKDGMVTVKTKVNVQEMAASNTLRTTLKKAS